MKNTLKIVDRLDDVTEEFQALIDSLNVSETLKVHKGIYHVRNIFFKSNIKVIFEDGTIFKSITKDENFKIIDTRVAGINMKFYAGVFNIIHSKNVELIGSVTIDGCGEYFWEKYWGYDQKGGMREIYDKENIRFLCDYDCMRVRNLLVQHSHNIKIDGLTSKDSGFWNIHVLYSHDVLLDNVTIDSKALWAPSTDGIDIDSSYNVKVLHATTYTNDDSICIKSGRDSDGIETNIPSHDIEISDSTINQGFGVTIGSELSGGIYNINIHNLKFNNTDCGFRIKSAPQRKGYIKNVVFKDNEMNNVTYPIHIALNWNPNYSNIKLPSDFKRKMLDHYVKITKEIDDSIPNTIIDGITIFNLNSNITSDKKDSRIFEINGFPDSHIKNFTIENSNFNAHEFGRISNVDDLNFINTIINVDRANDSKNDEYDNR